MPLEQRLKSKEKMGTRIDQKIYIDTLAKSIGFTVGTVISGGDPEIGTYLALKFQKILDRISIYK